MGISIVTKDNCPWCIKAKELLKSHNFNYREINVPFSLSREEFHTLAEKYHTTKTVPKIFDGNTLVGGYEDLVDWVENHNGGFGKGAL